MKLNVTGIGCLCFSVSTNIIVHCLRRVFQRRFSNICQRWPWPELLELHMLKIWRTRMHFMPTFCSLTKWTKIPRWKPLFFLSWLVLITERTYIVRHHQLKTNHTVKKRTAGITLNSKVFSNFLENSSFVQKYLKKLIRFLRTTKQSILQQCYGMW